MRTIKGRGEKKKKRKKKEAGKQRQDVTQGVETIKIKREPLRISMTDPRVRSLPAVQRSEGAGGELARLRRAAAAGGAEPGGAGGGHRQQAPRGRAPRPGAGPRSGERAEPAEEAQQRAGGARTDAGQDCLPAGTNMCSGSVWARDSTELHCAEIDI